MFGMQLCDCTAMCDQPTTTTTTSTTTTTPPTTTTTPNNSTTRWPGPHPFPPPWPPSPPPVPAPFLGGCAQNMVDEEEGIWWGDTEKTKCMSNREDVKGLTFVLTDNKADCNKGWFRKQVPANDYELV